MKKKNFLFMVSSLMLILFLGFVCIKDVTTHGFYFDNKAVKEEEVTNKIDITKKTVSQRFVPKQHYFTGIAINIEKNKNAKGFIALEITDSKGSLLGKKSANIEEIGNNIWYCVKFNTDLKVNTEYVVTISGNNCKSTC